MKLLIFKSLVLSLIASYVKAREVNFSLIAFCKTKAQLNVNGGLVDLTKETQDIPLWKVKHEVGDGDIRYVYIINYSNIIYQIL